MIGLVRTERVVEMGAVKLSLVVRTSKMDKNRVKINEKDTNKGYHRKNHLELGVVVFGRGFTQLWLVLAGNFEFGF